MQVWRSRASLIGSLTASMLKLSEESWSNHELMIAVLRPMQVPVGTSMPVTTPISLAQLSIWQPLLQAVRFLQDARTLPLFCCCFQVLQSFCQATCSEIALPGGTWWLLGFLTGDFSAHRRARPECLSLLRLAFASFDWNHGAPCLWLKANCVAFRLRLNRLDYHPVYSLLLWSTSDDQCHAKADAG